eukprot:Cvel_5063.t1-p1 / transcript=Cvel_5063.t1 / gene=Cvel_5063 / organism=Chromera_velia_CCMP2878 / gene_product=ABC transporter B family member 5, putative / transcript_product=ABC transporter B family member 5, putative / location=Cvel_scaffold230:109776-111397(+) / protein_length=488 / sequence_SO=supercontig / SO=protein_coding / is_pseudo=false
MRCSLLAFSFSGLIGLLHLVDHPRPCVSYRLIPFDSHSSPLFSSGSHAKSANAKRRTKELSVLSAERGSGASGQATETGEHLTNVFKAKPSLLSGWEWFPSSLAARFDFSGMFSQVSKGFKVLQTVLSFAFTKGMRVRQSMIFMTVGVLMLLSKWLSVRASLMTGDIVTSIQKAAGSAAGPGMTDPRRIVLVYFVTALLGKCLGPITGMIYQFGSMATQRAFTSTLFGKFLLMDAGFHAHTSVAEQETEYDRAVRGLTNVLDGIIRLAVPMLVELSLVIYTLGSRFGTGYAVQTLFTVVPYIVFTWVAGKNRAEVQKRKNAAENEASKKFYESVSNQETVKLFSKETEEQTGYTSRIDDYLNKLWRVMSEWQLLNCGQYLILTAGMAMIYISVFAQLAAGGIAVGDVVAITALFAQLSSPLQFAGWMLQSIIMGFIDMQKSLEILDRNPAIRDLPDAQPLVLSGAGKKRGPTVRLEGVSFGYEVPPSS